MNNKIYKKIFLTLACLLFLNMGAKAQVIDDVVSGIRNGNVTQMNKHFDNFVVITLGVNQSSYSKQQAEMVLRDFFSKNNPRNFAVMQSGNAPGNGQFAIGNLNTNTGPYQVYVLLKFKDGTYMMQEIRFEK